MDNKSIKKWNPYREGCLSHPKKKLEKVLE
jgi:hypothetical protein